MCLRPSNLRHSVIDRHNKVGITSLMSVVGIDICCDQDLYPDSCCTLRYPGCGHQAMATLSSDFANTFPDMLFTEGCLTMHRTVAVCAF